MMQSHTRLASSLSWLVAMAGLWMLLSLLLVDFPSDKRVSVNEIIAGVMFAALGALHTYDPRHGAWMPWTTALVGLWLAASPWVIGYAHSPLTLRNNVSVGLIVTALSLWDAAFCEYKSLRRLRTSSVYRKPRPH